MTEYKAGDVINFQITAADLESPFGPLWLQSADRPEVWQTADAQWNDKDHWHWVVPPGTWRIMLPPTRRSSDLESSPP